MKLVFVCMVIILLYAGCKKEKKPFAEFEGNWKPVSFSHREGTKMFPADFSYSISPAADSLIYYWLVSKSPIVEKREAYKLQFSIKTFLKDNSTLVIEENYSGLNNMGQVARTTSNRTEVKLVEGQSAYGYSPSKQSITSDRIETALYTTWGTQFQIIISEMVKME